jgi:hypothetical protein
MCAHNRQVHATVSMAAVAVAIAAVARGRHRRGLVVGVRQGRPWRAHGHGRGVGRDARDRAVR